MTRRSVGGFGLDGGAGLALMAALGIAAHTIPRQGRKPTPQEIAAHDKRTERQRWNDEVAARKADKQMAKGVES